MKKNKLLFLVTILVYLFLIGPLVVIMAASFSDTNYLKFPGEGFTLRWYQQVFTMSAFAKAARLSLFIALGGTAIALLFGLHHGGHQLVQQRVAVRLPDRPRREHAPD